MKPSRKIVLLLGVLLSALLSLFFPGNLPAQNTLKIEKSPPPLFLKQIEALNPSRLVLQVDSEKVLGWISGKEDFSEKEVKIEVGNLIHQEKVDSQNTFVWKYRVKENTWARFVIGGMEKKIFLAPPEKLEPSLFWITDRTVYRPGQRLEFAGFLRKWKDGEFFPLADQKVEVVIRSKKKKTLAGKIPLHSDESGRISGFYQFQRGDALDDYFISAPGYKGSATVTLAEFRKSKVKLTIQGKVEKGHLKVKFRALDFSGQLVPASLVQFTAQILSHFKREKKDSLKARDFIYHQEIPSWISSWESLSEEEKLLCRSNMGYISLFGNGKSSVAAQFQEKVNMKGKGEGEWSLALKDQWIKEGYSAIIQGVLVDQNGREQRAGKVISLEREKEKSSEKISLSLDREFYQPGDTLGVTAQGIGKHSALLVAVRLVPSQDITPAGSLPPYYSPYQNSASWNYRYLNHRGYSYPYRNGIPTRTRVIRRNFIHAVSFRGNQAKIQIKKPGAYKLIVLINTGKESLRKEIGCLVQNPEEMSKILLKVDQKKYNSGDTLRGVIQSPLKDARVLITLRDSRGIQLWKRATLEKGVLAFSLTLPKNLSYGSVLSVRYADEKQIYTASQKIRAVPLHRILTIKTSHQKIYGPGEKVKLGIEVNKKEPVDLVVSVYDRSLLGIAPDKSRDIRSFYLADERAFSRGDREILWEKIGDITIEEILKKGKKVLADPKQRNTPDYRYYATLQSRYNQGYFYCYELLQILQKLGIQTKTPDPYLYYWYCYIKKGKKGSHRIFDLLHSTSSNRKLFYRFYGDTLFVWQNYSPYYSYSNRQTIDSLQRWNGRSYRARGDSHYSLSANSAFSVSGQSLYSNLPPQGGPAPMELSTGSSVPIRRDFSDLAFWKGDLRTDGQGRAEVEFKLPDSLTNWIIVVTAVSKNMDLGRQTSTFRTFRPIMVWPMIPRFFTTQDKVKIYGAIHNRTDKAKKIRVTIKVENGKVFTPADQIIEVPANSSRPVYWTFQALKAGYTQILMSAQCKAGEDASLKQLPVVDIAAEQVVTASGFCQGKLGLSIPDDIDPRDGKLEISLAPTLLADMVDTLDYLVQYPHGCVEQTMSRFLPLIKVTQILKKFNIHRPKLEKKIPGYVEAGMKRLLQLQRSDGGWGWNGNGSTHEMMTPYALYGLMEGKKAGYRWSSKEAIQRGMTRLGMFIRNMRNQKNHIADRIYCMYVYSLYNQVQKEWWKDLKSYLQTEKLSHYALALALEMAVKKGKNNLAHSLAGALQKEAKGSSGRAYWTTANFSRWGNDPFEITAVVLKALVAYDANHELIPAILSYFASTKRGNRWNSTKDTAMILYSMCDYLKKVDFNPFEKTKSLLSFSLNGSESREISMDKFAMKKIVVPGKDLQKGRNEVEFRKTFPGALCRLVFRYKKSQKDIPPLDMGLSVKRRFYLLAESGKRLRELKEGEMIDRGSYIESEVITRSATNQYMRYVLVESPKPSGCEALPLADHRFNQSSTPFVLREDKTTGLFFHHEHTPNQMVNRCVFHLELAGEYVIPPASVELMYQTDIRGHSGTFELKVR